jgi:hypothetical protein
MWTFEEEQGAKYADLRTKQDIEKRLAEMQDSLPFFLRCTWSPARRPSFCGSSLPSPGP